MTLSLKRIIHGEVIGFGYTTLTADTQKLTSEIPALVTRVAQQSGMPEIRDDLTKIASKQLCYHSYNAPGNHGQISLEVRQGGLFGGYTVDVRYNYSASEVDPATEHRMSLTHQGHGMSLKDQLTRVISATSNITRRTQKL